MAEPLLPGRAGADVRAVMDDFGFDVERVAEIFEGETPETRDGDAQVPRDRRHGGSSIVAANPEKFTPAHLDVLAEYRPATKGAWRMKPEEQVKIARETRRPDRQAGRAGPAQARDRIKTVVNERRNARGEEEHWSKKAQTDPVKTSSRRIETVEPP